MPENQRPINVDSTLAAAAHAFLRQERIKDAELLASAKVSLEEVGFDNWNGGTRIWNLNLEVPYPIYLTVEDEYRKDIEQFIDEVMAPFLPEVGHWVHTKIRPSEFSDLNWRQAVAASSLPLDKYRSIDDNNKYEAFISYQTSDKHVAGKLQQTLEKFEISSFLAHEDIEVSVEWRERILEELGRARIFISLLSENYFTSPWCVQESGIVAYRGIPSLHLSLDGSIPQGFSSNIQSIKVNSEEITIQELIPGLISSNFDLGIKILTNVIGRSGSFRVAEINFRMIQPHIPRMSDEQIKTLLEKARSNGQVHHASLCASQFLPPLISSHGHLLDEDTKEYLLDVCSEYTN